MNVKNTKKPLSKVALSNSVVAKVNKTAGSLMTGINANKPFSPPCH
jgi:hypothetical protein